MGKISILICTYNRASILRECLHSLVMQVAQKDLFEVVVIDNNSTDCTGRVVSNFIDVLPQLRIVRECRQGLSYARNRGLYEAQYSWVAYLDDDARPHSNWVQRAVEVIASDDFDAFGGPYLAWHRYGPPPAWFASEWETTQEIQSWYGIIRDGYYPTGGNCFAKKDFLLQIGGFSPELGVKGKQLGYGEETALFAAMQSAGARVGWVPNLLVDHCVQPYKYTLRWRLFSAWRKGRDFPDSLHLDGSITKLFFSFCSLLKSCISSPGKAFLQWIDRKYLLKRAVIEALSPILWNCGYVCGILAQLCRHWQWK